MKIGIITNPLRLNYGGILQNYALQKTLNNMGHDVFTIDRHNDSTMFFKIISFFKRNIEYYMLGRRNVPISYKVLLSRKDFLYISKNLQCFMTKNINRTHYISSHHKIKESLQYNFDAYIVGSDQIWREKYAPGSFLDFLKDENVLRIAYAPSFGHGYWTYSNFLTKKCSELVDKFNAVSVREKSAVSLCEKYLNVDAKHVLDPTMLLTKEDYIDLIESDNIISPNRLMTYILDDTSEKSNIINRLLDKYELKQYEVKPKENRFDINVKIEDMVVPPISSWLKGFRDSKYVFTDSFHGTVFAILFNKPFIVFANKTRGLDRFISILTELELIDRMFYSEEEFLSRFDKIKDIDFNKINNIINDRRVESLNFLKNSLSSL